MNLFKGVAQKSSLKLSMLFQGLKSKTLIRMANLFQKEETAR